MDAKDDVVGQVQELLAMALGDAAAGRDLAVFAKMVVNVVSAGLGRHGGRPRKTGYQPLANPLPTRCEPVSGPETPPLSTENHSSRTATQAVASRVPPLGGSVSGSDSSSGLTSGPSLSNPREIVKVMSRRRVAAPAYTGDFLQFWAAYPRKEGKGAAWRSWKRLPPSLDRVLSALAWQCLTEQWRKDGGAYVPHPATYLNACRWEDEKPAPAGKPTPPPNPLSAYCDHHKVALNYRKPAMFPLSTCPECKHLGALAQKRESSPQSLLEIGGRK